VFPSFPPPRISSSGPQMEFEFNTDHNTAIQVLKLWNICLLESIPSSSSPEKLNEISSFLNMSTSSKNDRLRNSERTSLSFRRSKKPPKEELVKRADSFSANTTLSTKGTPPTVPHRSRESLTKSWGYSSDTLPGVLSQDSFFNPRVRPNGLMSISPPPLPRRPDENSSDEDGPDYAYIDENEVVGPDSQRRGKKNSGCVSPTVDAQLEALTRSIMKENKQNKEKKRAEIESRRRAMTLGRYPASRNRGSPRSMANLTFSIADPEDYLEPVPSKRSQPNRTLGQVGGAPPPQPVESVNKAGLQRNHRRSSGSPPHVMDSPQQEGGGHYPPTLPPRTWRKGSTTSNISTSSITSVSSVGGGVSTSITSRSSASSIPEINTEDSNFLPSRMQRPPSISSESSSPPRTRDPLQNSVIPEEPVFDFKTGTQLPPGDMQHEPKLQTSQPQSPRSTSPVPPPLPPRSPIKERHSHLFSSSSISPTSSSPRCPHCRNKKVRHAVGKTFSLTNHCTHSSPHEELVAKSSLPDLNKTSPVPENNLRHKQHGGGHRGCSRCSPDFSREALPSSSPPSLPSLQTPEYLKLVGEGPPHENEQPMSPTAAVDSELQSQLDILSKHVQTLEYLETKVSRADEEKARPRSAGRADEERRAVQTDLEAAMKQAQQVQASLSMPARKVPTEKQQPVQNGHTTYKFVSGTRVPPPAAKKQPPTTPISVSSGTQGPPPVTMEQQPTIPIIASNNNNNCSLTKLNGTPPRHWTSPLSSQHPPPPIPPRSHVSLEQSKKPTMQKQGHGGSKQHSPKSTTPSVQLSRTSYYTDPKPHPQQLNHMAPPSSTVFVHHLGDRRLNHLV